MMANDPRRLSTTEINRRTTRKYAIKTLSADITAGALDIADLRLNNLEIGKTYKLTAKMLCFINNDGNVSLEINHDGAEIGLCIFTAGVAGPDSIDTTGNDSTQVIFTATATTVTFDSAADGDGSLLGDGTTRETFVMLEELPNHEVTSEWD